VRHERWRTRRGAPAGSAPLLTLTSLDPPHLGIVVSGSVVVGASDAITQDRLDTSGWYEISDPTATGFSANTRAKIAPMSKQVARESALIRKIRSLPPEKVAEVEDFVEFLTQRDDRELTLAAAKLVKKPFCKVWDNAADAAYDRL